MTSGGISGSRGAEHLEAPLAITMGDPAGVGPEIISLALEDENLRRRCVVFDQLDPDHYGLPGRPERSHRVVGCPSVGH